MQYIGNQTVAQSPVFFQPSDLNLEGEERRVLAGPTRKVLLIVSGRLFRDGLRSLLHASGLTVVGHCDTMPEAGSLIGKIDKPDLIVVDTQSSPEEVQALRARLPGTRWILLCDQHAPQHLVIGAGFDWILFQDVSAEILHHVVELMLLGHSLVHRDLPGSALAQPTQPMTGDVSSGVVSIEGDGLTPGFPPAMESVVMAPGPAARPKTGATASFAEPALLRPTAIFPPQDVLRGRTVHLSDRETEILQCLVNGASNKAIARELNIAEATVKVHVKGLLRKMQLQNRTQAAIWAVSNPITPKAIPAPPAHEED